MEIIFTQVLVIGGGIAGMRAALAAREKGVEVILISKGKIGKSGSSLVANTGHRIYSPGLSEDQDMIVQTMKSGQGLADRELVEILARESFEVVRELQCWDCPVQFEYHQGCSDRPIYARCKERKGILITQRLRQLIEEQGVKILDKYSALQLITDKGRVIGVFATYEDRIYCFLAGAVILATGGVGRLYYPTDNPVDVGGDSVALAWSCGAEVMDLEFVQFYPYQLQYPANMDIHISTFRLGARLMNQSGDHFMSEYPERELVTRDILSREMFLQNGEISLDLIDIDLTELEKVNPRLFQLYLSDEELVVSPIQHFFMGGVRMDKDGRSTLSGLYVCGEAGSGVHGVNRLGGNALTECLVFGRRAGWNAALEALANEDQLFELDQKIIQQQLAIPETGEDNYLLMNARLSHIMWEGVGIVRDGEGLRTALHEIKKDLTTVEMSKPRSITEWYQIRNRLITAKLIAEAALLREESRGAHYRLDFPEIDPGLEGHLIFKGKERYLENS